MQSPQLPPLQHPQPQAHPAYDTLRPLIEAAAIARAQNQAQAQTVSSPLTPLTPVPSPPPPTPHPAAIQSNIQWQALIDRAVAKEQQETGSSTDVEDAMEVETDEEEPSKQTEEVRMDSGVVRKVNGWMAVVQDDSLEYPDADGEDEDEDDDDDEPVEVPPPTIDPRLLMTGEHNRVEDSPYIASDPSATDNASQRYNLRPRMTRSARNVKPVRSHSHRHTRTYSPTVKLSSYQRDESPANVLEPQDHLRLLTMLDIPVLYWTSEDRNFVKGLMYSFARALRRNKGASPDELLVSINGQPVYQKELPEPSVEKGKGKEKAV